jgi:hypothetical protein
MASKVFINQINEMMKAYLVSGAADIRARLCMSNCNAATIALTAADFLNDVTVDKCDASGYADKALTTEASTVDDANDRAEFTDSGAASVVFSGLGGNATRDYTGIILFKYVTGADTGDIPIAWIEFGSSVVKESTSVTVTWNAEGIIQGANA